ncbi:MAG: calcineurin-like phosphoesterase family protein [Bacteroidales bacterium]|nr:calcineurin-like phosphoesterase family protein [Bacteroidales bacterium]
MKTNYILSLAVLGAILCSCAQEMGTDVPDGSLMVEKQLTATIEKTKVNLDETQLHPFWEEGDKIAVYDGEALREFTLMSGAGTAKAVFSGSVAAGAESLSAVYPFSAATLESGKLSYSVPVVQTASGPGADPGALVMYSGSASGSSLVFGNCVSLLRFSVPDGVNSVIFNLDSEQFTMNLPGRTGNYSVAVPAGYYSMLTVYVRTSEGDFSMESTNLLELEEGHSLSLGELSSGDHVIVISTPEELVSFLGTISSSDKSNAVIVNDLDMTGVEFAPAAGFGGTLNGNGHSINITGATSPLFYSNGGVISGIVLEGTFTPASLESAPLVLTNNGTLASIRNKASVSVSKTEALTAPIVLGGVAAYNYGTMNHCINEGVVSFSSSSSIKGAALGGVAGYSEGALSNCSNTAEVSLQFQYGSGMCALGRIASSATNIGGVVGAAFDGFSMTSCSNSGDVVFVNDAIEKCPDQYQRNQIGGIVGSPYGDVKDCHNSGKLNIRAVTTTRSAFSAKNYILDVGGISGGSFHETGAYQDLNDHTSIIDCTNEGDIDVAFDANKSNSPIGGIVGWPSGEHEQIACKTSGCVNSGSITMSGAGKVRLGGIMGGTGALENCSNSGRLYIKSSDPGSCIGGINAFHSQDHSLSGCVNTGNVVSDITIFGLGGLIGCHGGVNLTSSASCKVLCDVISGGADRSGVGMVLGTYNKETSKNVVLGTPDEPIEVKGNVTFGGTSVELNKLNFSKYLSGTSYASTTHVIHAYCNTEAPYGTMYAEGTVKYSDGTPASGISVSDGFSVAVTDADGKYHLETTPDSWYIYVSMPSDAVIEKKPDGRPDFFLPYEDSGSSYNFTFKRQAVENEFMLFALADPQAHYAKRGGQNIADTDRFLQEAVPGINSHIASLSLPCYGVTLGDIVYSEDGRNSNPGLAVMVRHCAELDMPLFQTMGNHDYTFFHTNTPLTTDNRSSTLYLKAQRSFEQAFGPVNLSFNRGDVHVVCMRNIIYDSTTDASDYHCGYTDEQWAWLQADLANVPKTKMVILCGHIPLAGRTSNQHVSDILSLLKQYKAAKIFSGHTHYKRYAPSVGGINEHIHGAVCGQWWWSNIEGDGNPNGYTVYRINGTTVKDEYTMGFNSHMDSRDYQMRIYRGNIITGGSYAKFNWNRDASRLMINVFNGDSRWKVQVYENGTLSGNATLMTQNRQTFSSVSSGSTYEVNASSSQDWWAIGYHIGVRGRGRSNTSYYTSMYHMFTYTLKNPDADVRVVATDGYGNSYSSTEIISTDCWYPAYMKQGNVN